MELSGFVQYEKWNIPLFVLDETRQLHGLVQPYIRSHLPVVHASSPWGVQAIDLPMPIIDLNLVAAGEPLGPQSFLALRSAPYPPSHEVAPVCVRVNER